jgi:hypothetical protein
MTNADALNHSIYIADLQPIIALSRDEFWRDVEATTRLYNPSLQEAFVTSLINRRARSEVNERLRLHPFSMTPIQANVLIEQIVGEMQHACVTAGYLNDH